MAVKLAEAALDKGYDVRIFGYGEGVSLIKEGQEPKRFPNVGEEAKKLVETGKVEVPSARPAPPPGASTGRGDPGMKIGSLTNDLSRFVAESDRMVTIAR